MILSHRFYAVARKGELDGRGVGASWGGDSERHGPGVLLDAFGEGPNTDFLGLAFLQVDGGAEGGG